jgi:hypothetical protein
MSDHSPRDPQFWRPLSNRTIVGVKEAEILRPPAFLTRVEWLVLGICLGFWIGIGFTIILPWALR